MVKLPHINRKITAAVLLVAVFVAVLLLLSDPGKKQDSSQNTPQTKKEDTSQLVAPAESTKAPSTSMPKECNYDEIVGKIIGENSTKSGYGAKTRNSSLVQCNYRKDDKMITVQQYEYSSESEAKADLSKVTLKGSVSKIKGKYVVVATVVLASGPDMAASENIVNIGLSRL